MLQPYTDFHKRAIEKVKTLWHTYIINEDPDRLEKEFASLPEDLVLIGTGWHEFYKSREAFISGMTADQIEAREIQFELQDEWYEVKPVTDDVCIVYGSIWAREKATQKKRALVDMEGSRFTVVCRDLHPGIDICSVHHSMPYADQGEDEYYPKTLASLANEVLQKNEMLQRSVELDHLTDLYNRIYMEWHVTQVINKESGFFFVMDLDEFKNVNDTMGHLAGDKVIREFASLLREVFGSDALLGRMGGDEFAVWDSSIQNKEEAIAHFTTLLDGCHQLSAKVKTRIGCSAGISKAAAGVQNFAELYDAADRALYMAKAQGREQLCWAEEAL